MDNRDPTSYRLIAGFLPDNLAARAMETQARLFRDSKLPLAQALVPLIPLRWCTDDPERLSKLLTHSERPGTQAVPLRTGGWKGTEPPQSAPLGVGAALEVLPAEGFEHLVEFFASRTAAGPSLFEGAIGSLVLALSAYGTSPIPSTPPPGQIVSKVLRLGLLHISVEEEILSWEEYELGWLSRRLEG
jgi:hypothetical protein